MSKQKIAFFTISLSKAGAEKTVALLVNELYNYYDIHLVLLSNNIDFELPETGITVHLIDREELEVNKHFMKATRMPSLARKLKKLLEANNIPLLVSFLNRPNFISGMVKQMGWQGKCIMSEQIYTSHEYSSSSFSHRIPRLMVKRFYRHADLILPNSRATAASLQKEYHLKNRIKTIHSAINLEETDRLMQEPAPDVDFSTFTFITVGRLSKQKNHLLLLQAVQLLKQYDFKVLFVGRGELETELKAASRELGIEDKVNFVGFRNNPFPYLHRSDCFVLSSDFEGLPNVLLEALACGKPIISTDCLSGPREILTGADKDPQLVNTIEIAEYGILVPVNNAQLMADAMLKMMNEKELISHYATKARVRAADFDIKIIITHFREAFEQQL